MLLIRFLPHSCGIVTAILITKLILYRLLFTTRQVLSIIRPEKTPARQNQPLYVSNLRSGESDSYAMRSLIFPVRLCPVSWSLLFWVNIAMHTKNIKADLLLLMVAAIWGFSLVAQSMGLDFLGPFGFNAGRFLLGALTLLPVLIFFHRPQQVNWRAMLIGSLSAGFLLFMGASMQQAGLQYTTAGNAGFITSMYIVLVPVFGLALAQKTGLNTWIGAAFAVLGLYLLSVNDSFEINSGDALILFGACFWAGHVLIIAKLARELDNLLLSVLQFLFCGVLCTLIAFVWETDRFVVTNLVAAWQPLLFAGVLTVGIGHTLQVVGQKSAPASHAAIIMSLEAVFAALGGWLWLNEHLTNRELTGCMLMLAGVLLSQIPFKGKPKATTELGV